MGKGNNAQRRRAAKEERKRVRAGALPPLPGTAGLPRKLRRRVTTVAPMPRARPASVKVDKALAEQLGIKGGEDEGELR